VSNKIFNALKWRFKLLLKRIRSFYYFGNFKSLVHAKIHVGNSDNIVLGVDCSINYLVTLQGYGKIIIGDHVVFSPYVQVLDAGLDIEYLIKHGQRVHASKSVIIGSNSWIATGAIILPGVQIGCNCLVGAGSVVTKSFPDNSVIAGNPAKLIRNIKI
jgi:maltose O-acetyltransferase